MKRRLRLDEQPHPRLWEISVSGAVITLRTGLEGTPGVVKTIDRKTPEAALETAQQMLEQRLADGFVDAPLQAWEGLTPQSAEAEWLVYADTLMAQGDVRGELISLQSSTDPAAEKKWKALLKRHDDALLGELAGVLNQVELRWKRGFIVSARVTNDAKRSHHVLLDGLTTTLFKSPSVRMLQRLELGWPGGIFRGPEYRLWALLDLQWPQYLDTLEIGAFDPDETREWPTLHSIHELQRKEQLRYLVVRARMADMQPVSHVGLRHLELDGPAMTHRTFGALLDSHLPALRGLVITVGRQSVMRARHLTPLASMRFLPELAALGVRQCPDVTVFVERLIQSGRMAQLSLLDLSENRLNEVDGKWLIENAKHFGHLTRFVLRRNHFKPRILAKLAAAFPLADLSDQER